MASEEPGDMSTGVLHQEFLEWLESFPIYREPGVPKHLALNLERATRHKL